MTSAIRKTKSVISKGCGFTYAYLQHLKTRKKRIANGEVLILATGHIGNAILDAPALQDLIEHFKRTGVRVSFLCSRTMWRTFERLIPLEDVEFLDVGLPYEGNGTDCHTIVSVLSKLKGKEYDKIFVTLTNAPLAHYIVAAVPCNESWGIFDDVKYSRLAPRHFFERYYSNKLIVPIDMQETQRLKLMLEKNGVSSHRTRIQYIGRRITVPAKERPYITIAVDSMCPERKWSADNFIQLIRMLIEHYEYDIYLTGSNVPKESMARFCEEFKNCSRVFNVVGSTSFEEWVELLRGAQFHIGVDSGSIHVAASVGTVSFCFTGVWDGKRVLPYQVDEKDDKTVSPICIYRNDTLPEDLPCYACKVKYGKYGIGNPSCRARCAEGFPCQCLEAISPERVLEIIMQEYPPKDGKFE